MKKLLSIMVTIVVVVVALITMLWLSKQPKITVTPAYALIDQPISIVITNLKPHAQITLEATCKDKENNLWNSHALFQADNTGTVNVANQAPLAGSYTGIEPMGLFWSMTPLKQEVPCFSIAENKTSLKTTLIVSTHNMIIAKKTIERRLIAPNITRKPIHENGVVGTLFYQKNTQNNPGVIVISGSSGGIPEVKAQLLASHGYTVLALGYFGASGLPAKLENIPLEYFHNALSWFKKQATVDADHIAIFGTSRGGELVLLFASTFPQEINAVIAQVPSNLVYGGFEPSNPPAWTYKNKAIDHMSRPNYQDLLLAIQHAGTLNNPVSFEPLFLRNLQGQSDENKIIKIENIRCPLLILSGQADKVWPSFIHAQHVMQRLDQKKSTIERKHIAFADAGHRFSFPYIPSIGLPLYHKAEKFWDAVGGTIEGNARANEESWHAVLEFLAKTLAPKTVST